MPKVAGTGVEGGVGRDGSIAEGRPFWDVARHHGRRPIQMSRRNVHMRCMPPCGSADSAGRVVQGSRHDTTADPSIRHAPPSYI